MEFSGSAPLGGKAAVAVWAEQAQPDPTQIVTARDGADGARLDTHAEAESQDDKAAVNRQLAALRRAVARGDQPAGPPPTFEVSLLEVEQDLQNKLARMESEHAQEQNAQSVAPPAPDAATHKAPAPEAPQTLSAEPDIPPPPAEQTATAPAQSPGAAPVSTPYDG